MSSVIETNLVAVRQARRDALGVWTREIIQWHFGPKTGCPFWLEYAKNVDWNPGKEIRGYGDLDRFGFFQDEWLRRGPVRRWLPKAYADRPIYVFETGGSTGVPKSRLNIDDFRIDYEAFSATLPDDAFPHGSDWIMMGPRVHACCNFKYPLRFEDLVEVCLLVREKKKKSLVYTFIFRKLNEQPAREVARGTLAVACVKRHKPGGKMRGIPIPTAIADKIEVAPGELLD